MTSDSLTFRITFQLKTAHLPLETLLCVCRTSLEQENGFMMTQKLCFLMVLISYILLVEIIRIKAGLSG